MAFILNEVYQVITESSQQHEEDIKSLNKAPNRVVLWEDELFNVHQFGIPQKYFRFLELYDQCVLNSYRYLESIKLTDDPDERKLLKHNYNVLRRTENEILRALIIYIMEKEGQINYMDHWRVEPGSCHNFWIQESKDG